MNTQPELIDPKAPDVDADEVELLLSILNSSGWFKARTIIAWAFRKFGVAWNERKVRALASASGGRIISGCRGYKLTIEATAEEYNHYRNWMSSQADEMKRRVILSDKIFYARKPIQNT